MTGRVNPRHMIQLRVTLAGTDGHGNPFKQTVFTRDISARGARLTQVPPLVSPAMLVRVEYRGRKTRYRVVWVGGAAGDEIGLQSLEPNHCIWGTPLPGQLIRCVDGNAFATHA